MRHVNVKDSFQPMRALLTARPAVVLLVGFATYLGITTIFAALFFACSAECFTGYTTFGFASMFYFSIHTFSTIGFGSISPTDTCALPNILVLVESYLFIMYARLKLKTARVPFVDPHVCPACRRVGSAIGGYVFAIFMRTRPYLRFSQKVLLTKRAVGNTAITDIEAGKDVEEFLSFRIVTNEVGCLRDVTVRCQATLWRSGGDGSFSDHSKGRVESLILEQDYFTAIEQVQLFHKVDLSSPLCMRYAGGSERSNH